MCTLVLELTEEQLKSLEHVADQQGTSVESLVAGSISKLLEREEAELAEIKRDSIYNIRAHEGDAPTDLARNADFYLFSFTDCTSFVVMQRDHIIEAFTAD